MSDYIRVEGHSHLVRDRNTGAIINTNSNEIKMARIRKANRIKERNEIKELKNELKEMKQMLKDMIEVNNGRHND